jgi:hypothetical protein
LIILHLASFALGILLGTVAAGFGWYGLAGPAWLLSILSAGFLWIVPVSPRGPWNAAILASAIGILTLACARDSIYRAKLRLLAEAAECIIRRQSDWAESSKNLVDGAEVWSRAARVEPAIRVSVSASLGRVESLAISPSWRTWWQVREAWSTAPGWPDVAWYAVGEDAAVHQEGLDRFVQELRQCEGGHHRALEELRSVATDRAPLAALSGWYAP